MTREQKLALIVGFSLILFVGVLISDHLSGARKARIAKVEPEVATAPLSVAPIPAPGPAPETHAAAPTRDPLDLIMNPSTPTAPATTPAATNQPGSTQTAAATPASEAAPTTITGNFSPPPAANHDVALANEVRRLGGDLEPGTDGIMTIKLPAAADVVSKPVTSPLPVDPAPQPKNTIATPVGPIQPLKTHEIRSGDTLFQITQRYYGNGNLWRELAKFNNMDRAGTVRVGSRLKIPSKDVLMGKATVLTAQPDSSVKLLRPVETAPKAAPPKAVPAKDRGKPRIELASYTVRKGDTLGEISLKTLGTSKRWQEIADLNALDDEDDISTGDVLKIPARRS